MSVPEDIRRVLHTDHTFPLAITQSSAQLLLKAIHRSATYKQVHCSSLQAPPDGRQGLLHRWWQDERTGPAAVTCRPQPRQRGSQQHAHCIHASWLTPPGRLQHTSISAACSMALHNVHETPLKPDAAQRTDFRKHMRFARDCNIHHTLPMHLIGI